MAEEPEVTLTREEIKSIIRSYTTLLGDVMDTELDNILNKLDMKEVPVSMFPYIAALSVFGFCAKELDRASLSDLLTSVDIIPDEEIIDKIIGLKLHNYLIYVHIMYFLLDVGKEPTIDDMIRVARGLGFQPDIKLANMMLDLYAKKRIGIGMPDKI